MAPTESISPAGSSTYSSNLMYIGDGTWDASRNTFLLPNLVGLNFEMMRYNGMGNRFKSLSQYHNIITGHGVLAVLTFLVLVPTAILIAQFHTRSTFWAIRLHIYIQIITVLLSTAIFTLGWFAVGSSRSFTNPHHGIGTTIYLLVLMQGLVGFFLHRRPSKRSTKKYIITFMLHQWVGRATALLGFAQVALGLTLYGSPKFTFVLYTLWMALLLLIFFVLNYKNHPLVVAKRAGSLHGCKENKQRGPSRLGSLIGTTAAGAGAATLLHDRDRSQSRSRREKEKTTPSRRNNQKRSGSFEAKYPNRRVSDETQTKSGKVLANTGILKNWNDKKQRNKQDNKSLSELPDTSSQRPTKHFQKSQTSHESTPIQQTEDNRSRASKPLSVAGDPVATGALSHPEPQISTPQRMHRPDSYDSESSLDETTVSHIPSRQKLPKNQSRVLGILSIGWFGNKLKKKLEHKGHERFRKKLIQNESPPRRGKMSPRLKRDRSASCPRRDRRDSSTNTSDLSSDEYSRPKSKSEIPTSLIQKAISHSKSQQVNKNLDTNEIISMPPLPQEPNRISHRESIGVSHFPAKEASQRRRSSSGRRESEAATDNTMAQSAILTAEETEQRRGSRSRVIDIPASASEGPKTPVSVKLQLHDDKNYVTLRRLTKEEATAEWEARLNDRRGKRPGSVSSISGMGTAASNRRYRRTERETERRSEPPLSMPLAPPSPAINRKPKDFPKYSSELISIGSNPLSSGGIGGSESHKTWSARGDTGEAAAERRRRRRSERSRKNGLDDNSENQVGKSVDEG